MKVSYQYGMVIWNGCLQTFQETRSLDYLTALDQLLIKEILGNRKDKLWHKIKVAPS